MPEQLAFSLDDRVWLETRDGDPDVRSVFDRHYSRQKYRDGRRPKLFCGPGQKVVLRTVACDAIFVWRKFISLDAQTGVNCAVFRNEGPQTSSQLIRAAMHIAWARWGAVRLYTYVDRTRVRSPNPGWCFQCAGWRRVGLTKDRGLVILAHEGAEPAVAAGAVGAKTHGTHTQSITDGARERRKETVA